MSAFGLVLEQKPSAELLAASRAHVDRLCGISTTDEVGVMRPIWRLIQGASQSCTCQAGAEVDYGLTGQKRSPWVGWWQARRIAFGEGNIKNTGVPISGFIRAMRDHGLPPSEMWNPSSKGFSYTAEPPDVAQIAGQRHNLDLMPLYGTSASVVQAAWSSLSLGQPLVYTVPANAQFSHPEGDEIGEIRDRDPNDHMVVGWRGRVKAGRRQILTPNWWPGWGNGDGACWIDESWLGAAEYVACGRGVS